MDHREDDPSGIEKRRYKRKTVMWSGKLSLLWGARLSNEEHTVAGVVRDMSVSGAKFQTKDVFSATAGVVLEVPRFGNFNCKMIWQDGYVVGLNFDESPEEIYKTITEALPGIAIDPNPI
ncbi:PilZ domain-containing protein [Sneathiella marina]|uniref:PilZ domain-containing protein n=1 Tax=Sneathiella marina TaxID=2950108 RepID=A0ABY4W6G6_9PROT|nr:PilZ domain-containing protein [Sneathiella marina]USG62628.1 PilZ domain-containing protein [Sneathiella marina]